MNDKPLPPDFQNNGDEAEPKEYHRPEFILIDEGRQSDQGGSYGSDSRHSQLPFDQLTSATYPWPMRLLAAFLACLAALAAVIISIYTALTGLAVLVTLGYHAGCRQAFARAKRILAKTAIFTLGFTIAIFSPAFGLALIILYFLLLGERLNQELMRRILGTP